ncbi:hypothetical protein [Rhodopila globiformis]|uniref:hypothetical protein n=1 Tax=Rhodopila globiformis TaxID=1071 RepID=UPI001305051B|nr:hypothetical protein [Rhodopila globiformis]
MMQSKVISSPRALSLAELDQVGGGALPGVGVCKDTPKPKPENSAFGGAMVALAIVLLL